MADNLSIGLDSYIDSGIEKGFLDDFSGSVDYDLEKAKALPVGHINKYKEMKMPDGTWKYVGNKGVNHPAVAHLNIKPPKKGIEIKPGTDKYAVFKPGDTNIKNGVKNIKIADNTWIPYSEYLDSWGGNPPSETTPPKAKVEAKEEAKVKAENKHVKALKGMGVFEGGEYLVENILSINSTELDDILSDKSIQGNKLVGRALADLADSVSSKVRSAVIDLSDQYRYIKDIKPQKAKLADFSKCTSGQLGIINRYTGSGYSSMNKYSAGGVAFTKVTSDIKAEHIFKLTIDILDKGIENIENLNSYTKVYRGRNFKSGDKEQRAKESMVKYVMNIGGELTYGVVQSTTHSPDSVFNPGPHGIAYTIEDVKSGKVVSEISEHPNEDELIFPTTAKFKVEEARRTSTSQSQPDWSKKATNFVRLKEI